MAAAETVDDARTAGPETIYNCPECRHWLPAGTLACPDCHAMVYGAHLRRVAIQATAEENEQHWGAARDLWRQAMEWVPPGTKQAIAVEQKIAHLQAQMQGAAKRKETWTRRLGPLAPLVFSAVTLFSLLLKAKFLLSFVGFFAIYWAIFGWKFGAGFALSILVHEMGHYVAARRRGLKVDLPVFLPGLGAYVRWYSMGVTLDVLSEIALAGPAFGLVFALGCAGLAKGLHEGPAGGLFSALAHVTAWLNLLNLVPVFGLDGAQATYALDRLQRWLVLATGLIFFGLLHEWVFLAIAAGMGWRLWQGAVAEKPSTKTLVGYVLLLFALGTVMYVFPDAARRF